MYRGSRKHILDWTSLPEFCVEFLQLLNPVDVRASTRSFWMPRGYKSDREARLETFGPKTLLSPEVWHTLRAWWLAHQAGANTPNWDLAFFGDVEGRPGLVLVEAKANQQELSSAGKQPVAGASEASRDNHHRIGEAIYEACAALKTFAPGISISRDSHYQLSNRLAFTWKLASLGIPTVLVYLGFTGDWGLSGTGMPIRDAAHWLSVFNSHVNALVPNELLEHRLDCGKASAWVLVRSKPVIEQSAKVA